MSIHILIVDDEDEVRRGVRRLVQHALPHCHILEAVHPEAARTLIREHDNAEAQDRWIAVLDNSMGSEQVQGTVFAREIHQFLRSRAYIIMHTADTDLQPHQAIRMIIKKPSDSNTLIQAIHEGIAFLAQT